MATVNGNIKIRNLPEILEGELTSGNFVPVALNPAEGMSADELNPRETRRATFQQIVTAGAVSADFSEGLKVSGVNVYTGSAGTAESFVTFPPHDYPAPFEGAAVLGDSNNDFNTPISFKIGNKEMLRIDSGGVHMDSSIDFIESDKNLKSEIIKIGNPENLINNLNGVNFIWNEKAPEHHQGKKDIGLIAQEVERVIPSAVKQNQDGYLMVSYSKLVPVLIEAYKSQSKKIEDLEQRINNLENPE